MDDDTIHLYEIQASGRKIKGASHRQNMTMAVITTSIEGSLELFHTWWKERGEWIELEVHTVTKRDRFRNGLIVDPQVTFNQVACSICLDAQYSATKAPDHVCPLDM